MTGAFFVLGMAAGIVAFARFVQSVSSFEGGTFGRVGWAAFAVATAAFMVAAILSEAS